MNHFNKRNIMYALGILPESVLYNLIVTYLLVFLTDMAGLKALVAGAVCMFGSLWDALLTPYIGYRFDRWTHDRRMFLLSAVPMSIFVVFLFVDVNFDFPLKLIYYLVFSLLTYTFFCLYAIPYYALCMNIFDDSEQRVKIRGLSSFINAFAIYFGSAVPILLISGLQKNGIGAGAAWALSFALIGILMAAVGLSTFKIIGPVKIGKQNPAPGSDMGLLKTCFDIFKLKVVRRFSVFTFFYMVGSTVIQMNYLYLIRYKLHMSDSILSLVQLFSVVCVLLLVPLITSLAVKYDKRKISIIFLALMVAGLILMKGIGVNGLAELIGLGLVRALGTASFWTLFYPFSYELAELDELINNKRREGAVTSFIQTVQKIGTAISPQILSILLLISGFVAGNDQQTAAVANGIESVSTIYSAGFLAVALAAIISYPVTKKHNRLLADKISQKRSNMEYRLDDLRDIM